MSNSINIVLASDDFYFPYIYVAIKSLFDSNKAIKDLVVNYIHQEVPSEHLSLLKDLSRQYSRELKFIPFEMPKEFDQVLPAYGTASKTTYAKFWFASMFPKENRVLYLDPDVIVLDSIEEMYNTDFEDNLIAGVLENLPTYHMRASLLSEDDAYINGGMVLCNLEAWRKYKFEERSLERLKDTTHNLNYDQGILNELCKGRTKVIPPKYNVLAEVFEFKDSEKIKRRYGFKHYYSQTSIDEAINNPTIIHFTGFLYGKPLSRKCTHPYASKFRKILSTSPIEFKLNSTDIDLKKKVRKFFLRNLPFSLYLGLEKFLDRRRKQLL